MSGYFDGLMRATGLPLGTAPVMDPAPRKAATLLDDDASPETLAMPLPAAATSAVDSLSEPMASSSPLASTLPASRPAQAVGDEAKRVEAAPAAIARAAPLAADQTAQARTPQSSSTQAHATVRPAHPITNSEPTTPVSRQQLIQAAMRWVAAEPVAAPMAARAAWVEAVVAQPKMDIEPAARAIAIAESDMDAGQAAPGVPAAAQWVMADTGAPATAIGLARPGPSPGLQVSIGSIHLRVDAPPAPALQAAPAPRAAAPSSPRSGLSRRALPRI